jgi:hypothetical protein
MFKGETVPVDGHVRLSDAPGFGLELVRDAVRISRPYAAAA